MGSSPPAWGTCLKRHFKYNTFWDTEVPHNHKVKATLQHDGKAIENINRAADKSGMSHAEARRLLDHAFTPQQ